jgi:hypothetical protein
VAKVKEREDIGDVGNRFGRDLQQKIQHDPDEGAHRIAATLWSAPAERSGDGALAKLARFSPNTKAVSRFVAPNSTSPDNKRFGGGGGMHSQMRRESRATQRPPIFAT